MKRRTFLMASLTLPAMGSVILAPYATAGEPPIYTRFLSDKALGGYDPVSYHSGTPQKGVAENYYDYKGAIFLFVSQANRNQFIANPDKYAPAYGGYCAWAVAQGKLAPGNPQYWTIRDGRLYVNFNGRIQKRWEIDPQGFIIAADKQWPEILDR